jgi:hypothetical protein
MISFVICNEQYKERFQCYFAVQNNHINLAQGCQMVYFRTKNIILDKFCRASEWKMFTYFMVIWNILRPFGNVVIIWYIFPRFWSIVSRKIWQP